jgi:hypothetical protein
LNTVTDSEDCFYVLVAAVAKLLTKPANMHIEGAGADLRAIAPNSPQENRFNCSFTLSMNMKSNGIYSA